MTYLLLALVVSGGGAGLPLVGEQGQVIATAPGFGWIEVHLDPRGQPLAAWQLEVQLEGGGKVVGIEGGDHTAYEEPAHYDPRALQGERAVLAAFNTSEAPGLPSGRTRVATIMVEVPGEELPRCVVRLVTAATVGGDEIPVDVTHEVGR